MDNRVLTEDFKCRDLSILPMRNHGCSCYPCLVKQKEFCIDLTGDQRRIRDPLEGEMMAENLTYQDLILGIRELEDNEAILKEKAERLEFAINAVEDGVWDWDPCTGNTYFSSRWFSMRGFEPGELPATYETWVNLLHPDDRADAVNIVVHFLERPENPLSIEFSMRTR